MFECPDRLVDECIPVVQSMMEAPCPWLTDPLVAPDGLWCAVEVSMGKNLDYRDSENPEGMEKIK